MGIVKVKISIKRIYINYTMSENLQNTNIYAKGKIYEIIDNTN